MKMKNIILSTIAVLLVFFVSCTKFEKFESKQLSSAPTVTLTTEEVMDSSVVVSVSSSAVGYVSFALFEGVGNAKPDSMSLIELNVSASQMGSGKVMTANEKVMIEFTGLVQNEVYEVFAASQNADGVLSNVSGPLMIKTTDKNSPVLVGVDPGPAYDADKASDQVITLVFDEPIGSADATKFTFTYLYGGTESAAATAEVDPAYPYYVYVSQSTPAHAGDYFWLSMAEGAVSDIVGNKGGAFTSGLNDEGGIDGLYWRAAKESWDIDVATVAPENGTAISDPEFYIQFEAPFVVSNNADDGSVRLVVKGAGVTSVYDVPAANLIVDDNGTTVYVVKPFTPDFGESIYLEMDAGALIDDFGNPNSVIESGMDGIANEDDPVTEIGWLISYGYTIDVLASNYSAECTSDFTGDVYTFDITMAVDAEVENGVIITGLEGSDAEVKGVFDGDFGTITIAQDQSLGDLLGDGSEVLLWSPYSDSGDLVGHIQADGTITMDWASYIVGGDYDGYYWDRYVGSVWSVVEASGINIQKSGKINKNFVPRVRK